LIVPLDDTLELLVDSDDAWEMTVTAVLVQAVADPP
jgi:hypothetical protein